MTALTELSVIKMLPSHAERIAQLEKITFSDPWTKESLIESLERNDTRFLVCLENDVPVGYVGSYVGIDSLDITSVAVFPEYRRRGIAEMMLNELIAIAREFEKENIFLEVRESNAPAIALYKKLGFCVVGKRRGFYSLPREDALVMSLKTEQEVQT